MPRRPFTRWVTGWLVVLIIFGGGYCAFADTDALVQLAPPLESSTLLAVDPPPLESLRGVTVPPLPGWDDDDVAWSANGQASFDSGLPSSLDSLPDWLRTTHIGYDRGFIIASGLPGNRDVDPSDAPFLLRIGGLGQLRETYFDSRNELRDLNQFQLVRGRVILSGNAGTPDLRYFVQLDGLSSAGEEFRLLDYFLEFDLGRRWLSMDRSALVFKAGRYKVPFNYARFLSAREFQFADRSVASMFFDLNRSLGWGLAGRTTLGGIPLQWETSLFNGFVTGGAETGSTGALDNNLAYSCHLFLFPSGDWGADALSDFEWHHSIATRIGCGYAGTTIDRNGPTEFNQVRVVDTGDRLGDLLPVSVVSYTLHNYSLVASGKYRGGSATCEYYFRTIDQFEGGALPGFFDHGFWLQVGQFVIPGKWQWLARWSRVVGNSGSLGNENLSADEVGVGSAWYFRGQNAKLTVDVTQLNGAPINSPALDIAPGADGWLYRTQIQIAF